jgi:prefoldin subunit 5
MRELARRLRQLRDQAQQLARELEEVESELPE